MNEKYRRERARDNSRAADIRSRQNDAAGTSSGSGSSEGIHSGNADQFVRDSLLDLEGIAKQVAAEKDKED
jgi:hypothetical protein